MLGISFATVLAWSAVAAPTPLRLPGDVSDVYALDANPAGLSYLRGSELRLVYARDGLDRPPVGAGPIDGVAMYGGLGQLGPVSLGAAAHVDVDDLDQTGFRLSFGSSLRLGQGGIGWSLDRVRAPAGEARTRFNVGLSHRWTSWLSTGLLVRDVAQTMDRRRWDLGVAVRPLERLVISGRWRITQDNPLFEKSALDVTGLVSVEPIDGLRLGVGVQKARGVDFAVTTQLELGFGHAGLGVAAIGVNTRPKLVADVSVAGEASPALLETVGVVVVDVTGALQREPELDLLNRRLTRPPYGDLPLLLERLARSERVQGAFVRIGQVTAGWAKAQEVRAGLARLRSSGRRVDCLLGGSDDMAYFIASACGSVIVAPPTLLRVDGVAATNLFFGDALDRLGVDVEVARQGRYKSAPEQFTRAGMSLEQREALGAFVDEIHETLVAGIAGGRALEPASVLAALDQGTHTASQAVARGLVDHVLYPDEVEQHLFREYGAPVSFLSTSDAIRPLRPRWGQRPEIAIVYVDASISAGESEDMPFGLGQTVGAQTLLRTLDRLRLDDNVRSVVLRVDSPGGDALASDLVARAVERLAKKKPVIASLGDVAASGGYYVAAPATTILAEPTTLTGSIGVFSLHFSGARLLRRLGIGAEQILRGRYAGAGSPYLPWTEAERVKLEDVVEHYYEQFLSVVSRGRDLDRGKVHAVAQGRIWSGRSALGEGLVDELGGLVDAVHRAREAAGLSEGEAMDIVVRPGNRSALSKISRVLSGVADPVRERSAERWVEAILPAELVSGLTPILVAGSDRVTAALPFALDID